MRKSKFSAFNLAQLIITIAAVMFGVYALINAGPAAANSNVIAGNPDVLSPLDGGPSDRTPLELPDEAPKPRPRPKPPVDVPDVPEVFNPDDRGNGSMKGVVKFSDGRGVEGMRITAISTEVSVTAPNWDADDLDKTHADYDRYFRALKRNTRVTTTDSSGRFDFDGLDETHSYRVTASHAEVGRAEQVARTGANLAFEFEVPLVVEGVVSFEGKLPAQWWITSNVDTGQGWFEYVHSAPFTDPAGKFRIRAKAGKVQLIVNAEGWIQDGEKVFDIQQDGTRVELKLVKAAVLSGTVTSKEGGALQAVSVMTSGGGANDMSAWGGWGGRKWSETEGLRIEESRSSARGDLWGGEWGGGQLYGYTDVNGKYRIEGIRPGTYTVTVTLGSFTDSREVTVKSGENYADFSLDSGCRVTILGTSTKGQVVTPVSAWFVGADQNYAAAVPLSSDKAGKLEYIGMLEGTFTMSVQADGYPVVTQAVVIGRGANVFDVQFAEPGTLKGKVASSGGKVPPNLYVRLTPAAFANSSDNEHGKAKFEFTRDDQYYSVDSSGNYICQNVQPGDYKLSVEFNQSDSLLKQDIRIQAGEQTLDLVIDERCALTVTVDIAPEVKNKEGISISVSKTTQEGGYVSRYGQLDKNNQAEFAFLPEGDYYVYAYAPDGSQSYVTVSVGRGSNIVNLSLGPPNCVKLSEVMEGYQGAEVGLKVGDLVIEYNGTTINNMTELVQQVQTTKDGDNISMTVIRNGSTLSFRLNGGRIGINGDNFRR